MFTFLLSCWVHSNLVVPQYWPTVDLGKSMPFTLQIPDTSPSFIILSEIPKTGDNDPIVPPN